MPSFPRKWALLIGIDQYPNLSKYHQLKGCVNDVMAMGGLLRDRFGFPAEQVTTLTNAAATRAGILAALDALAEQVQDDDVVVVHYAGHGSQITDLEGDEPDGLDETIVPHDGVRVSGPNTDITDDEIHAFIRRIAAKTPFLTLLFDCCHSGTISRDTFGGQARSLEPDTRPADQLGRAPAAGSTRSAAAEEGPSGWLPLDGAYVLIAGCRDEQLSYEYTDAETGTTHGALTYFLTRALQDAAPGTTYRDIYDRVRPLVTAYNGKQHPQMEGALDREVFGVTDIEPMAFFGVEARDGGAVTLAGGAAHGLTAGSEANVFAVGTKTTEGAEPLGRVRITEVGAVTSQAEVVEEPGAIGVGARAVVVQAEWGERVLRVAVADAEMAQRIDGEQLLRAVPEGEPAEVRLVRLAARDTVAEGDPVPQLGALAEATWAAVGAGGRLVCPPHPASEAGVEARMVENLRKVAHYRAALTLDNPTPGRLTGTATVQIQTLVGDQWRDAEPDAGGSLVFEVGDRIAFSVTNHHTEPVFVNMLGFDQAAGVDTLNVPGANEAVAPGKSLRVGYQGNIRLDFPPGFPFVREPFEGEPDEGLETLKVFVTTQPTDFSALNQERLRGGPLGGPGSTLSALLQRTFRGEPMRAIVIEEVPGEDDDWTTVQRSWLLRRRSAGQSLGATPLDLGGITVRATGLEGEVRVRPSAEAVKTRSRGPTTGLAAVLAQENVATRQTIEVENVHLSETRTLGDEPEIRLDMPAVPGHGQLLLVTDASGVVTWHVPEAPTARRLDDAPAGTQTFVVRRAGPAETGDTRGVVSEFITSQLIERLVFPLFEEWIGAVGDRFAATWEGRRRPYGLRPFTPADYRAPSPTALGPDDWPRLAEGRSLLFVHGTFSRAHSAFGGLGPTTMTALHQRYEGRVFAFDHFTLSDDPDENVRQLIGRLPDDAALDLDIVCHSRGGLVSRVLVERQSALSLGARSLAVGKVVFVASPNAGTALADSTHMGDLIDSYTNLLTLVPDNPVTDALDGIVTVAKLLAVGVLEGLDGLRAMQPAGEFLRGLNALNGRGDTRYLALAADFKPAHPGLADWAKNRLLGRVFGAENDLVVPTASVYGDTDADGVDLVAEADRHVFPTAAGVAHSTFFQHPDAQAKLLTWLHA
ncbi:caspase family protein [Rubrivirga sp. IMCC43871]|uniref:DUF7379 domain-containing protein n=1 Tax=Rubrivirga sp. IMCC43871 TaxID=3391575 RepID=UPI00398FCE3F